MEGRKEWTLTNSRGFSLLEMSIVMLILGTLMGGLLKALGESRETTLRADTTAQLRRVEEALYGFAQSNGRLPCPATATSDGVEDPVGGGACTRAHGFVPGATLGLQGKVNADGLLLDSWGNPLRYSVATFMANAFTTSPLVLHSNATLAAGPNMLRVCSATACAAADVIATTIPAVVVSMGPNWPAFTAADEVDNAGEALVAGYRMANDADFVSTGYSEENFDDLLLWLSPNILFSKMISAGAL